MWIKIAVQEVGPITLVAFRASFGLLFGIVVIAIQRVRLPRTFKAWAPLLLLGLTNLAIPFVLISWGERSIDSAIGSVTEAVGTIGPSLDLRRLRYPSQSRSNFNGLSSVLPVSMTLRSIGSSPTSERPESGSSSCCSPSRGYPRP